jgi:tetratricopeptide (TPR) repeat protein
MTTRIRGPFLSDRLKQEVRKPILAFVLPKNIRTLLAETSPEKALTRATRLMEKGRFDSAASVLADALEAGGEEPRLRVKLSEILIVSGRTKDAAGGFRSALRTLPEGHLHLGEVLEWARVNNHDAQPLLEVQAEHLISRRDFAGAFRALERMDKDALKAFLDARGSNLNRYLEKEDNAVPRSALPLLYLVALIREALGDDPHAVDVYRKIVRAAPGEIGHVEQRLQGVAARHYRSAPLRGAMAEIFMAAGQIPRAVEEYVQMAGLDPEAVDRAAEALEEVVTVSSDPAPVLWGLVRVRRASKDLDRLIHDAGRLIATGQFADDLQRLLEALMADGNEDPRLQLLTGETMLRAGQKARAVAAFSAVARHDASEIRLLARQSLNRMLEEHPDEPKLLEAVTDNAIRDGNLDEAIDHLSRYVALPGGAAKAAIRLQAILLTTPDHAGAEALLERIAPELDNPGITAAFLRRRVRAGADEAAGALEAIASLRARHPQDPELRIAAAEAHAVRGEWRQAWEEILPLLDSTTGPDPSLLHLMVLIGGSSRELSREISGKFFSLAPALASSPEGQFALGEMAVRSGDMAAAAEAFRSAASCSASAAAETIETIRSLCGPDLQGEAALLLVDLLVEGGNYTGAAEVLSTATKLPGVPAPLMEKLQKAFRANPEQTELRIVMAAALAAGGNAAHARRLIEDGIRRAGSSAPATLHLAAGDAWLREDNLTESVRAYSRAMAQEKSLAAEAGRRLARVLEMDVGHPGAHLALGRSRLLEGHSRDGVNALLTAWSIRPALGAAVLKDLAYAAHAFPLEPQVDLARAQILLGQGEVEAASDALGSALKTAPSIAGEVMVRLQAIVQSHPSCARAHLHAARAWRLQGRCGDASKAYLAAAEIAPDLMEQAATGLAEMIKSLPDEPGPHVARASLCQAREQMGAAAEAYRVALEKGAAPEAALEPLRRVATLGGPTRGRVLLELARACRSQGLCEEAAGALEEGAAASPDLLGTIRQEMESLFEAHPDSAPVLTTRARLALAALEPGAALPDAESLLDLHPSRWGAVADLAFEIAEAGGDPARCALLRARSCLVGGDYNTAADLVEEWMPRTDGKIRLQICLIRARVERRRGQSDAASRWMMEAFSLAEDKEEFLAVLHAESVAASKAAAQCGSTASELWRALRAALDLGDAEAASRIAASLGLEHVLEGHGTAQDVQAAREALAQIASLRGEYGSAADLLLEAPASPLKAYVLQRAGRLMEALACMEALGGDDAGLPAAAELYRRLAAEEFLGEPACVEAETQLDFSAA